MIGTCPVRLQGYQDPLLVEVMKGHGFDELPLYKHRPQFILDRMKQWFEMAKDRDGPVAPEKADVSDAAVVTAQIKKLARDCGADAVGVAKLEPYMIDEGVDLPHDYAICMIVGEDYAEALDGPRAIERESTRTYIVCAEASTRLAQHIRAMGFPAVAHHNGAGEIQAVPAMWAAGLGELGKHGSLIHPGLGASHRPGIVTTTLPLVADAPVAFGVQETCLNCNLCSNNCPGDAIPMDDFTWTEGVRRWVTDVERCYVYSRLRPQYCHICVDVCPYVHKANGDADRKTLYKAYMGKRKKAGWKTPAWFPEEEAEVLGEAAAGK